MPRFVLLYHDCPPSYQRSSHWDLMLEAGEALRTWSIEQLPSAWRKAYGQTAAACPLCRALSQGNSVAAERLGEHRRDYLEYEGPLSNNHGSVTRIAAGTYLSEAESPDCWQVTLCSDDLSGRLTLARVSADSAEWTLICEECG